MFRKLTTNFLPHRGGLLSAEKAVDVLQKAATLGDQASFGWIIVDKPIDGSMFVFQLHPSESIPEDGYDEESVYRTRVGDKELEVYSRNQGFGIGERVAHIMRRRYRLAHSDLQLMHYLQIPDPSRHTPVHPPLIKVLPRDPAALAHFQLRLAGQAANTFANIPHQTHSESNMRQALANRKRNRPKASASVRHPEEVHEILGDEIDASMGRAVALERYKRNHEFLDMIFSPYNSATLVSPQMVSDASQERLVALKEQLADLSEEVTKLDTANETSINVYRASLELSWRDMEDIKQCDSLQALEAIEQKLSETQHNR
ncbi:hypothetical protein DFS34DRAFT_645539 [Phlyctochytrium arcticum]|nr:hypothetical protein DFS34DRAFT_645539 [Phlyctochytrium arcticum]